MTSSHTTAPRCHGFSPLAHALDPRSAPRRARLFLGTRRARGRRTGTSWTRAASLSHAFRCSYTTASAAGKRADGVAARLVHAVVPPRLAGMGRRVLAIDDPPTPRYGPQVHGAGVHHSPAPGPAGSPFGYGHVWVVLGLLATHPAWGVIARPRLARLYVREKDLPATDEAHRPPFATTFERAVGLVRWAKTGRGVLGQPRWVVADGAYAKAAFRQPLIGLGVVGVRRLRRDAALWAVPAARTGTRGRPRTSGERRIALAERAGPKRGWRRGAVALYGKAVVQRSRTLAAAWRPAGGAIRVVRVDAPRGWVAFFRTAPAAAVADILGVVAERSSLETAFREVKGVVGAGPQQVRHVWASVGSFHLCRWTFTLTECWAWDRAAWDVAGHRPASPWGDTPRRPSHADERRAWRREVRARESGAALRDGTDDAELRDLAERLRSLAA